jgi:hypothetical protein
MKYEYKTYDCIETFGEDEQGRQINMTALAVLKNNLSIAAAEGWKVVSVLPAAGYRGYLLVVEKAAEESK